MSTGKYFLKSWILIVGFNVLMSFFSVEADVYGAPQSQNDSLRLLLSKFSAVKEEADEIRKKSAEIDSLIEHLNKSGKATWFSARKKSRLFAEKAVLTEELDDLDRKLDSLRMIINRELEPLFRKSTERIYALMDQIKTTGDSSDIRSLYIKVLKVKRGRDILVNIFKDVNKGAEMAKYIGRDPEVSVKVLRKYPWLVKETERYLRSELDETEKLYQSAYKERQLQQRMEELDLEANILSSPDFIKPNESMEMTSPQGYYENYSAVDNYDYYLRGYNEDANLPSSYMELNFNMEVFLSGSDDLDEYIMRLDSLRTYYRTELQKISGIEKE